MELDTICRRKIWSTDLLIVRCHPKWTPLGVLQQPWRGGGTRMILVYIKQPLTRQVQDFRAPSPPPPNCVRLTNVMRRSCQKRGQGSSRKRATRRVHPEQWASLRLSLVRISSVEQQAPGVTPPGMLEALTSNPPTPSMDEENPETQLSALPGSLPSMAESQRLTHQEAHAQDTLPESREVLRQVHKQGSPSSEGNQRPQTPVPVQCPHLPVRTGEPPQVHQFIFKISSWIDLRSHI